MVVAAQSRQSPAQKVVVKLRKTQMPMPNLEVELVQLWTHAPATAAARSKRRSARVQRSPVPAKVQLLFASSNHHRPFSNPFNTTKATNKDRKVIPHCSRPHMRAVYAPHTLRRQKVRSQWSLVQTATQASAKYQSGEARIECAPLRSDTKRDNCSTQSVRFTSKRSPLVLATRRASRCSEATSKRCSNAVLNIHHETTCQRITPHVQMPGTRIPFAPPSSPRRLNLTTHLMGLVVVHRVN